MTHGDMVRLLKCIDLLSEAIESASHIAADETDAEYRDQYVTRKLRAARAAITNEEL